MEITTKPVAKIKKIELSSFNFKTGEATTKELKGNELKQYLAEKNISESEVEESLLYDTTENKS